MNDVFILRPVHCRWRSIRTLSLFAFGYCLKMSLITRSAIFAFILMISVSSILALNVDKGRASNATDSERHERCKLSFKLIISCFTSRQQLLLWNQLFKITVWQWPVGSNFSIKLIHFNLFSVISLFTVVRFANSFCYGSNGYNGTWLTSAEGASVAGTTSGSCAGGFGVCCTSKFSIRSNWDRFVLNLIKLLLVFVSTCGKTANRNNTYWLSPGYGNAYFTAGQCSIYVKKCDTNICQLRYSLNKMKSSEF